MIVLGWIIAVLNFLTGIWNLWVGLTFGNEVNLMMAVLNLTLAGMVTYMCISEHIDNRRWRR